MVRLHWLEHDTLVIFNLQPMWIAGLSNCKIKSSDLCHSLLSSRRRQPNLRENFYINCSSRNLEGKFWNGIWNFIVKTCFQIKSSVATRTRAMIASQWYQSLEELMEKSTYWSWAEELCKWTWSNQFRRFQGSILLLLASGKSRKVNW